jgi:hypothetical protein
VRKSFLFSVCAILSAIFFQVQAQDVIPFTTIKTVLESGSQYPTTNIVVNDSVKYNSTLLSLAIRPEWVYYNRKTYVPDFTTNSILISSYMQYWSFRQQKITSVVRWGDTTIATIAYDSIGKGNAGGVGLSFGYRYQIVEVPKITGVYTVKLVKSAPIAKQSYTTAPQQIDRGVTALKLPTRSMVRYDALGRKTFMTPGQQKIFKKMTFQPR